MLYSYNQLLSLYGENDSQVKTIKKMLGISFSDIHNRTLEAFKRIEPIKE